MGPDERTPEQKDAEGRLLLDELHGRWGLFGWGPILRRVAPTLAEAVAERSATGRVSPETAARAAAAVQSALLAPEPIETLAVELPTGTVGPVEQALADHLTPPSTSS